MKLPAANREASKRFDPFISPHVTEYEFHYFTLRLVIFDHTQYEFKQPFSEHHCYASAAYVVNYFLD